MSKYVSEVKRGTMESINPTIPGSANSVEIGSSRSKKKRCCPSGFKNKRCKSDLCKKCCNDLTDNKECRVHLRRHCNDDKESPKSQKSKTIVDLDSISLVASSNDDDDGSSSSIDKGKKKVTPQKIRCCRDADTTPMVPKSTTVSVSPPLLFDSVVSDLHSEINSTMSLMESSDFDKRNGLNETGFKLIEPSRNKERTFCCGAGGGVKQNSPKIANKIAKKRLEQLGSKKIIVSCPYCYAHLKENVDNKKKIVELSETLVEA